ncbi:MAG: hypothetical protein AAB546_01180 [Patescibacteria group bacterium]
MKTSSNLPAIFIALLGWVFAVILVLFIDPQMQIAVPVFFVIVFINIFTTCLVLLKNKKRSFLYSLALILFLFLRYFGMGSLLNFILIIGIVISIEIFTFPR